MKKTLKLQTQKVSKLTQNGNGEQNKKITPMITPLHDLITTIFK